MTQSLTTQYQNQHLWRDWQRIYKALPILGNKVVLDLGCAIGDQTYALSKLGAKVIGVDMDEDLLAMAAKRNIPDTVFYKSDLSEINSLRLDSVDGIWSSFTIAYFPDLRGHLENWQKLLRPGGWMALTEMSGLLDHKPLAYEHKKLIHEFYQHTKRGGWYDFQMGDSLREHIKNLPLELEIHFKVKDRELSFQGPASQDVYKAWEQRLERMGGLKRFLGDKFETFRDDFLASLQSENHQSMCAVHFYLLKVIR